MAISRLMLSAFIFATWVGVGYAGPCSREIDRMQARIDAKLEQTSAAGPEAHESVNALENRQPTPGSIAAAESKLGELSPKTVKVVASAMALARMADQADNRKACQRALEDVERALGP